MEPTQLNATNRGLIYQVEITNQGAHNPMHMLNRKRLVNLSSRARSVHDG